MWVRGFRVCGLGPWVLITRMEKHMEYQIQMRGGIVIIHRDESIGIIYSFVWGLGPSIQGFLGGPRVLLTDFV